MAIVPSIPIGKLLGYCLNPNHLKGKHKARVFKSTLGITADNLDRLVQLIQRAAVQGEVVQARTTDFGQEFKLDWAMDGHDEDYPARFRRASTCLWLHQIIMSPKLLDTIALVVNLPHDRLSLVEQTDRLPERLPIGLVGTIVHIYEQDSAPSKYLVEFSDAEGREEAMANLDSQEFVVLQYELAVA
jgi:Domain of unknown function (DUF4926)